MKKVLFKYIVFLTIAILVMPSCKKKETYPVIPEIKYEGFVKIYNPVANKFERGVLKLSFKDGDGDIGLRQSETEPPYDYNLFVKYYEIQNRDTVEVILTDISGDTITFNARIPILTPTGSNKSIKGEIDDTLFIYNYQSNFDTIMYEVYLIDRALNKSNIIFTPLINRK
ncbi:MAG: hypothetical protein B6D61_11110 [Bacteroidetes bacterium 4484_249]|nr:MAG: hypothetical protein B6D61_11110 [Bacteroidetes bacterium 4484_249]